MSGSASVATAQTRGYETHLRSIAPASEYYETYPMGISRVHRHIGLTAVRVTQNNVRTRLPSDNETGALQSHQHLTRFVRHFQKSRSWRKIFR